MKLNKQLQKTFSLQKDQTDCGVGCLQSLVRFYGGDISLEILREKSGTSKTGTTLLGLFQCANEIGFDAEGCEADINALIEHKAPVILHVIIENKYEHYVVCYSFDGNLFTIGDPAKGIEFWNKEQLLEVWKSKTCLTLKTNETFRQAKVNQKEKRDWLLDLIKKDSEAIYTVIFLGVLLTLLGMSMSIFSQKLIDDILPQKKLKVLILSIAFLGFLLIGRVLIQTLRELYIIKQSQEFNQRINKSFFFFVITFAKIIF